MSDPPPDRRRLFVAAGLPESVRVHLATAVEPVHDHPAPAAGTDTLGAVRWADPATWHLTLVFCGRVAADQEVSLVSRLRRSAARHRPLRLELAGGGRFGNRVLWVGVAGDRAGLVILADSAAKAARVAGIDVEDRPYRPHLTIARGRPGADLRPAADALRGYRGPAWTVKELVLVESRLGAGPGGSARYGAVEVFRLG